MDNIIDLFGQPRTLYAGLRQQQEQAAALIVIRIAHGIAHTAADVVHITEGYAACPSHTPLCFARHRLGLAPFLINRFSLLVRMQ